MSSQIKKLMEKYQDIFNIVKLTEDEKKEFLDNADLLYKAFNDVHKQDFYNILENYFEYIRVFMSAAAISKQMNELPKDSPNYVEQYNELKKSLTADKAKLGKIENDNTLLKKKMNQYIVDNKLDALNVSFNNISKYFSKISNIINNNSNNISINNNRVDQELIVKFENKINSWTKEELEQFIIADMKNINIPVNQATFEKMKECCQKKLDKLNKIEQKSLLLNESNKEESNLEQLTQENQNLKDKLKTAEERIKELEDRDIKRENKMQEMLDQLNKMKESLEEMKQKTLGARLKKDGKAIKRKVVKVQDWFKEKGMNLLDWYKNHKVLGTVGILAIISLGGLIGSTIAYGYPLAFAGRVVSALWQPLHKIGLGEGLHNINKFLFGKLGAATFSEIEGTWINAAGKALNDLGTFEMICNNVIGFIPVVAAASGAAYGIYRGVKKARSAWLNRAENGFVNRLTNKVKELGGNIKEKATQIKDNINGKFKNIFKKHKENKNQNNSLRELNSDFIDMDVVDDYLHEIEQLSDEDYQEVMEILEKCRQTIENGDLDKFSEDYDQNLNLGTLNQIIKMATFKRNNSSKNETIIQNLDDLNEEELDDILEDLLIKLGNDGIGQKINWEETKYGVNNYEEAKNLYDMLMTKRKDLAVGGMSR